MFDKFLSHTSRGNAKKSPPSVRLEVELLEDRSLPSGGTFGIHIHPNLSILLDGVAQEIPEDIGIDRGIAQELHTHDVTGRIHVESNTTQVFTLQEFIDTWRQTIAERVQETGSIASPIVLRYHETLCRLIGTQQEITVNGEPAGPPDTVILDDGDQIVIDARQG